MLTSACASLRRARVVVQRPFASARTVVQRPFASVPSFPPVVDGRALFQHGASHPEAAASIRHIDIALQTNGVFLLKNHGGSARLASEIDSLARLFWSLPRDVKARLQRGDKTTRGWTDNELTKRRLDLKELYGYGAQGGCFDSAEGDGVDGANRFFSDADEVTYAIGGMRAALARHFAESQRIGRRLVEAMAVALGRADDEVDNLVRGHNSFAVLNFFAAGRAGSEGDGSGLGVSPHTDAGLVTLLRLDDVSGLEILVRARRADGSAAAGDDHFGDVRAGDVWMEVPPPEPNVLVVNLGDMAQVWSNDRWHAAVHRVRSPATRDRYSHAHFVNPNEKAKFGGVVSPRYRSFRWADFRAARAKGDALDIGAEVQIAQYRTHVR